jgi:hypothetical protein
MFNERELEGLIDQAGVFALTNGWQLVIRAEWTIVTPQRPHGLSYALILQDQKGNRLLGFDNSHAYDDAPPDAPFDHEHPPGMVNRRIRYDFISASTLIQDGFERAATYCESKGEAFDFVEENP